MNEKTTEKVQATLSITEVSQIDYLVDRGFFNNRSDFIRLAVRNSLESHGDEFRQFLAQGRSAKNKPNQNDWRYVLGIERISKNRIIEDIANGTTLDLRVIGAISIDSAITLDEIKQVIKSVKVTGFIFASNEIKEYFEAQSL